MHNGVDENSWFKYNATSQKGWELCRLRQKSSIILLFFLNLITKHTDLGFFLYLTDVMHPEVQENVENINYCLRTLM